MLTRIATFIVAGNSAAVAIVMGLFMTMSDASVPTTSSTLKTADFNPIVVTDTLVVDPQAIAALFPEPDLAPLPDPLLGLKAVVPSAPTKTKKAKSKERTKTARGDASRKEARVSTPPADIHQMVEEAAKEHGVPPKIAHAVIRTESEYRCGVRSKDGATGIMQVLPGTARGVGVHGDLRDCRTGLRAGMRYLRQALDTHGEGCAGISAYQSGIRQTSRCSAYGKKVMAKMRD